LVAWENTGYYDTVTRSVTGFSSLCKVFCVYCLCRSIFLRLDCGSFRGFTLTLRPQQSLGAFFSVYWSCSSREHGGTWVFWPLHMLQLPPISTPLCYTDLDSSRESGGKRYTSYV